jgi:hypothetical protein
MISPERTKNFVAPYPDIPRATPTAAPVTVLPPAERLLTRGDIMASHRALLGLYETQQQEIADGWGGHRWESGSQAPLGSPRTGLYLATNILLTATTTGGIALITWLLGAGPAWAIAGWIATTGMVALILSHRQHAAELAHSPIGLARLIAEQTYDLMAAGQDAHYAMLEEERADARAARAAQDAARAAQAAAWMPRSPQAAQCPVPQTKLTRMPYRNSHGCAESEQCSDDGDDGDDADDIPAWLRQPPVRRPAYDSQAPTAPAAAPAAPAAAPAAARPPWAAALLGWAASAHDGLGPDGLIIRATPWAARSPWPSAEKRAMVAILTTTPAIVVAGADGSGGGRYRLDIVAYPDAGALLAVLGHRLDTVLAP